MSSYTADLDHEIALFLAPLLVGFVQRDECGIGLGAGIDGFIAPQRWNHLV